MLCIYCRKKRAAAGKPKNVTFDDKPTVFYFEQIATETNVNWQEVAVDRYRFKRRMLDVEKSIGRVFVPAHRKQMFRMIYDLQLH